MLDWIDVDCTKFRCRLCSQVRNYPADVFMGTGVAIETCKQCCEAGIEWSARQARKHDIGRRDSAEFKKLISERTESTTPRPPSLPPPRPKPLKGENVPPPIEERPPPPPEPGRIECRVAAVPYTVRQRANQVRERIIKDREAAGLQVPPPQKPTRKPIRIIKEGHPPPKKTKP